MNTLQKLKQAHKGKTATQVYTIDEHPDLHTVQYHATRVATVEERPSSIVVKLNSGGYLTKTTKVRINDTLDALGIYAHVYQRDFVWYLQDGSNEREFYDGISLERAK